MPSISYDFPAGSTPSAVTMLSITGSDGTTVSLSNGGAWSGPVTESDGGRFTYPTFAGTATSYACSAVATVGGVVGQPFTFAWPGDVGAGPKGQYATLGDLTAMWGVGEIAKWSNIDPSSPGIPGAPGGSNLPTSMNAANVQAAFNRATAIIHARFRSAYVVPFVFLDPTELVRVAEWEATLAGYRLYQPTNPTDVKLATNAAGFGTRVPLNDYAGRVAAVVDAMENAAFPQFPGALAAQLVAGICYAPSVVSDAGFGRRF